MSATDYDARCAQAVEDQGLGPALAALHAVGIPATVDQTGGFVMCVRVERSRAEYLYVTTTELGPDGTWMVYRYDDRDDVLAEGLLVGDGLDDAALVFACRRYLAGAQ